MSPGAGAKQQLTTVQQEMMPLLGPTSVLGCLLPSRVTAAYLADSSGARHGPRCPRGHATLSAPTHPSAQFPSYLALSLFLPLTDPYMFPADLPSTHLPCGHRPFCWAFLQPASLLPPSTAALHGTPLQVCPMVGMAGITRWASLLSRTGSYPVTRESRCSPVIQSA